MNTDRRSLDILLHRDLETFGLTPEEYRLYGHLVATIQSPAPDPASACQLTPEASKLAFAVLTGCGLITSVEGRWVLCDSKDWAHGMVEQVREGAKRVEPPKSPHQEFIAQWCTEYEVQNGFKYVFQGQDARAVKTLLGQGKSVEWLIETARAAWSKGKIVKKCWNCQQAATIHGFALRLNGIQMELKEGCQGQVPPSMNGSKVYGEKLEAREL